MDIEKNIKSFQQLSLLELYDLLALREKVFTFIQKCTEEDIDGRDPDAFHLLLKKDGQLVGYLRIFPPPHDREHVYIGRVVVDESVRGKGIGRQIMEDGLAFSQNQWPQAPVKVSAQSYLLKFYASLGFRVIGDEYMEAGIPHHTMIKEIA